MNGHFQNGDDDSEQLRQKIDTTEDRYICRSKYMVYGCAGIIIVAIVAAAWLLYFSPTAQQNRVLQQDYQRFIDQQDIYEQALRQDTYGGHSPQETLSLFIKALEEGDLELASKYFVITESGTQDPQWLDALERKRDGGELEEIIEILKKATPAEGYTEKVFAFEVREGGLVLYDINLQLNEKTGAWKIENL